VTSTSSSAARSIAFEAASETKGFWSCARVPASGTGETVMKMSRKPRASQVLTMPASDAATEEAVGRPKRAPGSSLLSGSPVAPDTSE
jgi:hypothetical protein